MKNSKDLESWLQIKIRETPGRWNTNWSTAGQHDVVILLQNRKQVRQLSGIAASHASPDELRRSRSRQRGVNRPHCNRLLTRIGEEGWYEGLAP